MAIIVSPEINYLNSNNSSSNHTYIHIHTHTTKKKNELCHRNGTKHSQTYSHPVEYSDDLRYVWKLKLLIKNIYGKSEHPNI